MGQTSFKDKLVSCGLALEVPLELTGAGVAETSSRSASARLESAWGARPGASSDLSALGVGPTEADYWI